MNQATEIRALAERQIGEFLRTMPKATEADSYRADLGARKEPRSDTPSTLAEIGITKKQSARAQELAAIPEDEFKHRIEAVSTREDSRTVESMA